MRILTTADLELATGQYFQRGSEGHLKLPTVLRNIILIPAEHTAQTLLEDGLAETISEHHKSTRRLDELAHLQHTNLIQTARKDVHGMQGGRGGVGPGSRLVLAALATTTRPPALVREAGVVLARGLVEGFGILHQIGVAAHGLGLDPADDGTSYWQSLTDSAPGVGITAILNPDSGPGSTLDTNYTAVVGSLQAAGGRVIGYVHTSYGTRSAATVRATVR